MNVTINFPTDCASLSLFDLKVAKAERILDNEDVDYWDPEQVPAISSGRAISIFLGGDGVYQLRITDGDLLPDERDYAADQIAGLGLQILSGRLQISGYGFSDTGISTAAPNGLYLVTMYEIRYACSPRWWRPDGLAKDGPADYVAVLRPRDPKAAFKLPEGELRLDYLQEWSPGEDHFLFESATRVVGAQPGMILDSTVIRYSKGFYLKECGPDEFRAHLPNYDGLGQSDRVRFRVISTDREEMCMHGELIEKLRG